MNPVLPGVGAELKRLLRLFRIVPTTGCRCAEHAREMDARGPDWCERNIELICDWMEVEAARRKLTKFVFSRAAARTLVRIAIRNTRRKQ